MVTHNLGYTRYASRTIKLQDGRIVPFTDDDSHCAVTLEKEQKADAEKGGNGGGTARVALTEVPAT